MADNAVSSEKIKDDAVTDDKIGEGSVQLSFAQRTGQHTRIEPGGTRSTDVTCNEGKIVVGGGFENEFGFSPTSCPPQCNKYNCYHYSVVQKKDIRDVFWAERS